jgi:hypothetical protein
LISSERRALAEKTSTIARAERIARTIAAWKFAPGGMSRQEIQQLWPRCSRAAQIRSAISWSRDE